MSSYSIIVENVPKNASKEKIKAFFERTFADRMQIENLGRRITVEKIDMLYNLDEFSVWLKNLRNYYADMYNSSDNNF